MDEAGVFTRLNSEKEVTSVAVERVVARAAKVPEKSVAANESVSLINLSKDLCSRVFGQEEAVENITHAIHSSRAGLNEPDRPVAKLLFVGPTGVGKTEVAKQLAELLGIQLSRFDMSEYQEKHAVARLIGSPPGYVGYEEGGLLTDSVRKTPHCVLLLDEIEKAHPDILNVLLQVMDYGTLTDNAGKKADFSNVIIIMTSNAGAREMTRQTIGFDGSLDAAAADKAVEKLFSPEFRNRLDATVRFKPVDKEMAQQIAKKAIKKLAAKLAAKNVTLTTAKPALDYIASKGLSETYGAREIIRLVENDVKKLLVHEVLFGELKNGGACKLTYAKGELKIALK
jgi:ATP-dependent Clp protease ATP-binding subunit ClpA